VTKLLQIFLLVLFVINTACGKRVPPFREGSTTEGYASWYGAQFNGRKTASGEVYDMNDFTAAHRNAPFGTRVVVTNLDNQRTTTVRINDRGPFVKGRILDVSKSAAKELGMMETGTARVRLRFLPPSERAVQNPNPSPSRTPFAEAPSSFYVQVASFRAFANAQNLKETLLEEHPNYPLVIVVQEGFHRLWIGPYDTEQSALAVQSALSAKGKKTLLLRR